MACMDRDFNFIVVNDNYAHSDGKEPDFYIGKNHFDLFPNADNQVIFQRVVDTGEPYYIWAKPFEYAEHPERGISYWDWSLKPVLDDDGKVSMLILTLWDVTSRVKAEIALRESENRLKKVMEVDAVGVMFWDFSTGRLVDANSTFLKMMGYSRSDIENYNLTWQKFTPPEYYEVSLAEIEKFRESGRVGPYEKQYFRKDGSRIWLLFSGSSLGDYSCVEFCIDISDRKKAESELVASEARYMMLYQTMRDSFVHVDMDGRIINCNDAYCQMLGYSHDEISSLTYHEITPVQWHELEARIVSDQIMVRGYSDIYQKEYRRKDGTVIPVELRIILAHDPAGIPSGMWGIVRDITERKRLESELKKYSESLEERVMERTKDLQRLNEALLKSNKELESFAYITSHDLQEPLRMITSYTQLLAIRYKDQLDDNARDYINFAVEGAKRMYDLINGFLDYSRVSKGGVSMVDVDMNEVVETVKADLSLLIREKNCRIDAGGLPVIRGNNSQLIRLLQNLVANGIKFSRNEPHIRINSRNEKTHYVFSVEDNGIGIESQYFEKIFEIFKRLNSREHYPGTGIGLAICRRIVENHNGKIWVESSPGNGSVFYFTIPKVE